MIKLFINLKGLPGPFFTAKLSSAASQTFLSPCFKDPHRLSYIHFVKELDLAASGLSAPPCQGTGAHFNDFLTAVKSFLQIFFIKTRKIEVNILLYRCLLAQKFFIQISDPCFSLPIPCSFCLYRPAFSASVILF